MNEFRRKFMTFAGIGAAGATLAAITPLRAQAQTDSVKRAPNSGIFDVKTFGAKGDGTAIDTPAVNRAIEAANKAGGGTVRFPAGTYACYSIHLKSNVAVYIEQGATILAASTPDEGTTTGGYDAAEPNPWENYQDYGHNHWHNSLIWGEDLHDVSITGQGVIWGKGLSRGDKELPHAESPGVGNKAIALKNCRNVLLRDFSILKGGHFAILATGVDNLTIDNLKIDTDRDGMDIDCCRNVRVSNCSINSPWDDGICPKSSFALGYARATENVTITNCYVTAAYQLGTMLDGTWKPFPAGAKIPRTGRIKFGTESNGGFKNIAVSNCVLDGCRGIALESVDGALLEDVTFTGITIRNCTNTPIFLRLGSRMRGPSGVPVGTLNRIILSDIVSYNCVSQFACIISGIPGHCVEDIKISDVYLHHQGGGTAEMAALQPAEEEASYPDPRMFGRLPARGFFLRHARNIEFSNLEIAHAKPDLRPAFWMNDVSGVDLFRVKVAESAGSPVFKLDNVKNIRAFASRGFKDLDLDSVTSKQL